MGRRVFNILICLLILFSLFRIINGYNAISFSSLLDVFSNAPQVSMPFKFFNDLTIVSDWGIFNGFRDFLNVSIGLISVLVFLAVGMINAIVYLTYFVRFVFI